MNAIGHLRIDRETLESETLACAREISGSARRENIDVNNRGSVDCLRRTSRDRRRSGPRSGNKVIRWQHPARRSYSSFTICDQTAERRGFMNM